MYFSIKRKKEIMTTPFIRNGIYFLMKELKKSNKNHHNSSSHHSSSHNCSDSSSNRKDSMILTLQAITFHLEAKTNLHKVGRKIIG
jgi:hypothetical protein